MEHVKCFPIGELDSRRFVMVQATLAELRVRGGLGVHGCGSLGHDTDVVEWPPPSRRSRQRAVDVEDLGVFRRVSGQTKLRPSDAVRQPRGFVLSVPGDVAGDRRSQGTDGRGDSARDAGVQPIPDFPARSFPWPRIGVRRRNRGLPPPETMNTAVRIDSRRHSRFRPGDHRRHVRMCGLPHAVDDRHRRREAFRDDQVGPCRR